MNKMTIFAVLVFVLITILFSVPIYADYHYASHTGSDQYPYTSWETAADSIQKAINAATAGDTIYVGSGVWEDVPIYLYDGLALIGRGIDSTTIQKGSHTGWIRFVIAFSHTLVQDFNFNGINQRYTHSAIEAELGAVDVKIYDNRFVNLYVGIMMGDNSGQIVNNLILNCDIGLNAAFDACSLLVQNNTFRNISSEFTLRGDKGQWTVLNNIFAYCGMMRMFILVPRLPSDTFFIANNLFYRNQEPYGSNYTWLMITPIVAVCRNNTIIGPAHPTTHGAITLSYLSESDTFRVFRSENNIFSNFDRAYNVYYTTVSAEVSYTDLWHLNRDYIGNGSINYGPGVIRQDPMFEDTIGFRLQAYSPLIDAGDPDILDVDGTRSDIGFYGGPHGSSYEYRDLPPLRPDSLRAIFIPDTIFITWRQNYEADFFTYKIHRDTISGFTPSAFNLISETNIPSFMDLDIDQAHNYFYKIASEDYQRNVSEPSPELAVYLTAVDNPFDPNLPRLTDISRNYPNPFNSQTIINYYLSDVGYQPAEVQLYIYDIGGKLVRKLVDTRQYPGGHQVVWDGLGEGGGTLSSGIYFARLIVSGIELAKARKITLVK